MPAHLGQAVAEHEVAGGDVGEDGVHAAAVAAALVVQLHHPRPELYACLCRDHLGRPGLVLLALLPVFCNIPSDEVWTLKQYRQSNSTTCLYHSLGDTLDMLQPKLLQHAAVRQASSSKIL